MADTESNDTPRDLPDFQAGVNYEVQMARAVEFPAGTGNYLRPDHTVTLEGSWANQMKGDILYGRAIPEAP